MAISEALNHGAKAHRAPRMPHSLSPVIGIEEPAQSLGNGLARMQTVVVWFLWPVGLGAVFGFLGVWCGLHWFFTDQWWICTGCVPLAEGFGFRLECAF